MAQPYAPMRSRSWWIPWSTSRRRAAPSSTRCAWPRPRIPRKSATQWKMASAGWRLWPPRAMHCCLRARTEGTGGQGRAAIMSDVTARSAAPLDEVMLAMDVVDTLRHQQGLATRELDTDAKEAQLIDRLRDIYHQQGIEVSDHILREGVVALQESRFTYDPPAPSFGVTLARLYVGRQQWGKPVLLIAAALVALFVGYFGVWQPYQAEQAQQARIELAEGLPAQMDNLYDTIFEETKVQQAVLDAEAIRTRGQTFAAEGNRPAAEDAVEDLTALRDLIRQEYTLRVVNRADEQSGFWTFPEINTDATNYYLVVEALNADGQTLSLPILNEETGATETVSIWGVRVPEAVYDAVVADKRDDGIIQNNEIGRKSYGFIEVNYNVPVSGGAVTRW